MENIDLRLIRTFLEIYRSGSLSQAAQAMDVSQPAVSQSLTRLRAAFQDPLFVRTPGGMLATPHARSVEPRLRDALQALEAALGQRQDFDPAQSTRSFRISMTDIGHYVVLPALLEQLRAAAPQVSLETVGTGADLAERLRSGEIDLAVGFIPQLDAGFFQQGLFTDRFVCVTRAGHPLIDGELRLDALNAADHLVVSTSGTGHYIVDRALEVAGVRRNVVLRIPHFMGVAPILQRSDLICIVPERAAQIMHAGGGVQILPLPLEITPYLVKQHWHERFAKEPGNRWLRQVLARIFQSHAD